MSYTYITEFCLLVALSQLSVSAGFMASQESVIAIDLTIMDVRRRSSVWPVIRLHFDSASQPTALCV